MRDNKTTIRTLYDDVLSRGRTELLRELIAPEYPDGPAGFETMATGLRTAFPDLTYAIEDLVGEADRVAVRWRWTGTHLGPFRGHPPTHKEVTNTGQAIFRLRDGVIVAGAIETDRLGFLEQVAPASAPKRP